MFAYELATWSCDSIPGITFFMFVYLKMLGRLIILILINLLISQMIRTWYFLIPNFDRVKILLVLVSKTSHQHILISFSLILVSVFGKWPTQWLDNTNKAKYSINITLARNKICSSLHCNESTVFCMLRVWKYINSKQKILK